MISETAIVSKLTRRLIPFMFLLYVVSYLDRINVGFAALQLNKALNFDPAVFGLGAGLFFIGYFIFEIPSNLIMERVGARVWMARILVTWGLISSAMMFVGGVAAFYALRFLLGVAEAGFFPGMILYLTYWFPAAARGRAIARFMTATAIAGVIGGPISGVLLNLHGIAGLAGWQWLFLIEGIPAIILGFLVFAILPDGPQAARWFDTETGNRQQACLDARSYLLCSDHELLRSQPLAPSDCLVVFRHERFTRWVCQRDSLCGRFVGYGGDRKEFGSPRRAAMACRTLRIRRCGRLDCRRFFEDSGH